MEWLIGVVGIAIILSPFVLGYTANTPAFLSSIILGAGVTAVSAVKGLAPDKTRWEFWVAGILGMLLVAAPFALNFFSLAEAVWLTTYLGMVVAILACIQLRSRVPSMAEERLDEDSRSKFLKG